MTQKTRMVEMVDATLSIGHPAFSLATIGLGVTTILSAGLVDQSYSLPYQPPYQVIPVIPWLPTWLPWAAYLCGAILAACGVCFLFKATLRRATLVFGAIMFLGAIFLNLPKYSEHLGDMAMRTEVFEPLSLAALAWLLPGRKAIPAYLERGSRYLVAVSCIVFGVDHFLALAPIGRLIPNWIPWHVFWIAFFGAGFIAAGLSIGLDVLLKWGAGCFGLMFALWVFTLHIPGVAGAPTNRDQWSSLFIAVALWGGSWGLARSQS
jgi:hypothetical protein